MRTVLISSLIGLGASLAFGATNDHFLDRTLISGIPVAIAGTTVDGSLEANEPQVYHILSTVWYQWTAPFSGNLRANIVNCSTLMMGSIYSGTALGDLQLLQGFSSMREANFEVQQGVVYQFRIAPDQPSPMPRLDGPFTLRLEFNTPPINDHFTNRIRLNNALEHIRFRSVLATLESGETPVFPEDVSSVWYEWKAPEKGTAYVTVDNSHNTAVGVYMGSSANIGTLITNNNQGDGIALGGVAFNVVAGQVYQLVFDNRFGADPGDREAVLSLNSASRFEPPKRLPDGLIGIAVFAEPLQRYALEVSTNLNDWISLATNISFGPKVIDYSQDTETPMKFFRTRLIKP